MLHGISGKLQNKKYKFLERGNFICNKELFTITKATFVLLHCLHRDWVPECGMHCDTLSVPPSHKFGGTEAIHYMIVIVHQVKT